jgi:hypothetical protein
VDPLADARNWVSPYNYVQNNPLNRIDPDGAFDTKAEARQYAKDNDINTGWFSRSRIQESGDGTYAINNKRESTSISNDKDFGVMTGALVTENKTLSNRIADSWNSPTARTAVPDFVSVGAGFSGVVGIGGGTTFDLNWVTRGPEASFYPVISTSQSVGGGYSVDATINIGRANYLGPANEISRSMIQTIIEDGQASVWVSGGVAAGGKVGITGTYTPPSTGYGIVGGQLNIGGGLPAGPLPGNIAGGVSNTFILKDFYRARR